jgi:hypothetical protein
MYMNMVQTEHDIVGRLGALTMSPRTHHDSGPYDNIASISYYHVCQMTIPEYVCAGNTTGVSAARNIK